MGPRPQARQVHLPACATGKPPPAAACLQLACSCAAVLSAASPSSAHHNRAHNAELLCWKQRCSTAQCTTVSLAECSFTQAASGLMNTWPVQMFGSKGSGAAMGQCGVCTTLEKTAHSLQAASTNSALLTDSLSCFVTCFGKEYVHQHCRSHVLRSCACSPGSCATCASAMS